MTQTDEIKNLITDCYWKQDIDGIPICRGMVLPCEKVIDNGQCDTLIEYFAKENSHDN